VPIVQRSVPSDGCCTGSHHRHTGEPLILERRVRVAFGPEAVADRADRSIEGELARRVDDGRERAHAPAEKETEQRRDRGMRVRTRCPSGRRRGPWHSAQCSSRRGPLALEDCVGQLHPREPEGTGEFGSPWTEVNAWPLWATATHRRGWMRVTSQMSTRETTRARCDRPVRLRPVKLDRRAAERYLAPRQSRERI
jgi:hypothetical protein